MLYRQYKGKQNGFTLIELLVVIAIIGLLASLIAATVSNSRIRARDARRLTEVQQIKAAMDLYFTIGGGYPPATLFVPGNQLACGTTPVLKVPGDPIPGNIYVYAQTGSATSGCGRNDLSLGYTLQFTLEKDSVTYTMDEDGQFTPSFPEL